MNMTTSLIGRVLQAVQGPVSSQQIRSSLQPSSIDLAHLRARPTLFWHSALETDATPPKRNQPIRRTPTVFRGNVPAGATR
jgi:hypothetical protein